MIEHFLCYEFVYVFLFSSFIFLAASIFIKQKNIKVVSILLSSVCFVLFCFELALSFSAPRYRSTQFDYKAINVNHSDKISKKREIRLYDKQAHRFIIFDEENGVENIGDDYYNENKFALIFSKQYSVYEDTNFRYTQCNKDSQETYVFLGCSFSFGTGVEDNETLPYYFSEKLGFKYDVVNYGLEAKSTNSALNILNTGLIKGKKYEHFFFTLFVDAISRNFRLPNYRHDATDIFLFSDNKVSIPYQPFSYIINIFKRSYIFGKIFLPMIYNHNQYFYEQYLIESLEKMNDIVEEKYNSKLTIIVWDKQLYNENFIERLRDTKLDLIILPENFALGKADYRIKSDGHPSARANKEIAQILYEHINKGNN